MLIMHDVLYFIGAGVVFIVCICLLLTINGLFSAIGSLLSGHFFDSFTYLYAYIFWFPHMAAGFLRKYFNVPYFVSRILFFFLAVPVQYFGECIEPSNSILYIAARICWYIIFLGVFLLNRRIINKIFQIDSVM